jgi:hypothetical protein
VNEDEDQQPAVYILSSIKQKALIVKGKIPQIVMPHLLERTIILEKYFIQPCTVLENKKNAYSMTWVVAHR